ncbi:hypothetical protein BCV72DRAFT_170462, partial [Rhizopus microsporus var. microsporus]
NYFLKTPVDQWSVKDAFDEIERNNPSSQARENLQKLRDSITDAKITEDETVVNTARKLLKDWKIIKKTLTPKKDKARSNTFNNVNNGAGVIIAQPAKLVIHNNANLATSLAIAIQSHTSMKRSTEDVEDASSSGIGTWESLAREKKKRKYINVYLGNFYGDTDFGTIIDKDSHWKVDGINVT